MRLEPVQIKIGLQYIANREHQPSQSRQAALDALAYIRQLEGDLRRAGFTEYNDPKEKETEE